MFKTSQSFRATAFALAGMIGLTGFSMPSLAMPFAATGASKVTAPVELVEVQVRRRVAAPVKRRRNNNGAAVGAAIVGLGVLGIAAAAASQSRPRQQGYYTDEWGNPVDAYGRPLRASRPVQYYRQDPGYYGQPSYVQPGYGRPTYYQEPRLSRQQKDYLKAQERARRDAHKQAVRQQRAEQEWALRQQQRRGYAYPQERVQRRWEPQNGPQGLNYGR
jgi:hypothetical protein